MEIVQADVDRALRIAGWWSGRTRRAHLGELESAALEGLAQAAVRFTGGDFWAYASRRIIGAMRDELRRCDHLTRDQRRDIVGEGDDARVKDMPWLVASEPMPIDAFRYSDGDGAINDPIPDPLPAYQASELGDALGRAIRKLEPRERLVLLAIDFAGYRNQELMVRLRLSGGRVSQLLTRAREKVRLELGDSLLES